MFNHHHEPILYAFFHLSFFSPMHIWEGIEAMARGGMGDDLHGGRGKPCIRLGLSRPGNGLFSSGLGQLGLYLG